MHGAQRRDGWLFLFNNGPPSAIGGMEIHALHMRRFFRDHTRYPLAAVISKGDRGGELIVDPEGTMLKWVPNTATLASYLRRLAGSERAVCFFNSGHWIEDLGALRELLPGSLMFQRTGGNDVIQASLRQTGLTHGERQKHWAATINSCLDAMVANSRFTCQRLISIGIDPAKLLLVPGGVDVDACWSAAVSRATLRKTWFRASGDTVHVLCACRLVPFKGIDTAIDAVRELATQQNLMLWIAGHGPLADELQRRANDQLGSGRCRFLGPLRPPQCLEVISAADVLFSLSRDWPRDVLGGNYVHTETMGRSVFEAIACGTRVVASTVGGLPEVVRPEYGTLVPPDHPVAAAEALIAEFAQPRVGPTTLTMFHREFSWEAVFRQYQEAWKNYATATLCNVEKPGKSVGP